MTKSFLRKETSTDPNMGFFTTPMLDMAFQLLAFFILFYRPGGLVEGRVLGQLAPPKKIAIQDASQARKEVDPAEKQEIKPEDLDKKTGDEVVLFLKAVPPDGILGDRGPGDLVSVRIKALEEPEREVFGIRKTPEQGMQVLREQLTKIHKRNKDTIIYLQPDANLRYHYLVMVWNACAEVGFEMVNFGRPTLKKE